MAQSENRPPRGNRPPPAQDPNFNWRGVVLFAVAIALIGGAFLFKNDMTRARDVTFPELVRLLEADKYDHVVERVDRGFLCAETECSRLLYGLRTATAVARG